MNQVLKLRDGILINEMEFVEKVVRMKAREYDIEMNNDLRLVVEAIPRLDPSRSTLLHAIIASSQARDVENNIKVLIASQASIELFTHTALFLISSFLTGNIDITEVLMYLLAGYSIISKFDDQVLRDAFALSFGDEGLPTDGWDIDEMPDELGEDCVMTGREKCDIVFGVLERVGEARNDLVDYRFDHLRLTV